jgi:hypothetical protein
MPRLRGQVSAGVWGAPRPHSVDPDRCGEGCLMVSVKKRLKKLSKRQDELERSIRNIKPKRLRRMVRRLTKSRGNRLPAVLRRRTAT